MVGKLATLPSIRKTKTSDRVNHTHAREKGIQGYWIGLEVNFENTIWNLDIWYQKPEWQNDKTSEWLEKFSVLANEQRASILRMKEELRAQGRYGVGKEFVAVDVYRAVLEKRS